MISPSNKNVWLLWLPAALFIFFQFILQVFPSVALDSLGSSLKASLIQIGSMSALFYYAFAISLLPIGILMDRLSIRKMLAYSVWLCVAGSLIFAVSSSLTEASFGRIMMGMGGSAAFVGTMRIVATTFPLKSIGLASGLTIAAAMLGAILGQTLLSNIIRILGWRSTMIIIAVLGFLLGWLIIFTMNGLLENKKIEAKGNIQSDLATVIGNSNTWKSALYASLIYIPLPVFAGLWGIPYFYNVYHFSLAFASLACAFVWLGMGFGSPLLGRLSDHFDNRRTLMLFSSFFATVVSMLILYTPISNKLLVLFLMFILGVFCGSYSLAFSTLRSFTPDKMSGTAVAFVMTIVMVTVAAVTQLIGFILYFIKLHQVGFSSINTIKDQYQTAASLIPIFVFAAYFFARQLPK